MPVDRIKLQPKSVRARSTRSSSPSKSLATPAKAKPSPRKRQTKAQKEANLASTNAANASLQSALDDAASNAAAEESHEPSLEPSPELNGEETDVAESEAPGSLVEGIYDETAEVIYHETPRVEVSRPLNMNGTRESIHDLVTMETPTRAVSPPVVTENTRQMLETARRMVDEANALEFSPKISRKRRVEEVEPSDIEDELPIQTTKKARVLEEKLKREQVRTRALVGVTATLAIA